MTYLINFPLETVKTEEEWAAVGYTKENSIFVEVVKDENGDWVEVVEDENNDWVEA